MMAAVSLPRRLTAEFVGSALLLIVVVGSGIMGERLAAGNTAVALLANSLATGCGLLVLITILAPVSGAHFNPAVSLVMLARRELRGAEFAAYVPAQLAGAVLGVAVAHLMFDLPLLQASHHARHGPGQLGGEFVACFGLIATILGALAARPAWTSLLVAAYITGAYWFTSSTSFANPAVTIARALTETFAGIAPADVSGFIAAQLLGALAGAGFAAWLWRAPTAR